MFLKEILWVFCAITCVVVAQDPKVTCKSDLDARMLFSGVYGGSYSSKLVCVFENIKTADDMTNLRFTPSSVGSIVFVNSSLSSFPAKFLSNLSLRNVRNIDASKLSIEKIDNLAFNDVKILDSLDLSENKIKKIMERVFASMQIRILDLSQNIIETIEENVFAGSEITKLVLNRNKIKSFAFVNGLTKFITLDLNDNLIETLEKIDSKPDTDASAYQTRHLIFGSESPKISVIRNKLKKIDCNFGVKIGGLSVEENFDLSEILLNDCQIDTIDASNCGSIKVDINDNLKSLTLKNTKVSAINFNRVKSLTTLDFTNSSLSGDVLEQIMTLENLTYLDLSHNKIGPLNISTFAKLKNLQALLLKNTNISQIVFGSFSHQNQLKSFDISDNHLKYFDMNMIFSMSSLLTLDLSGNDLQTLDNVENSHFMFTLLAKIDLSANNWPCSYLMRLVKIFRTYRVALVRSNLEEKKTNLHGIACIHVEGEDNILPLEPSANLTDIRAKIDDIIEDMGKTKQFRTNTDTRIKQLELRIDNQIQSAATSDALRLEKKEKLEVQNSTLLETALVIVCICFTVFMSLQTFSYIKRNFLGRPRQMRASSENPLTNVDYD